MSVAQLPCFPYALFFRIVDGTVHVIACFHSSRNPRQWQSAADWPAGWAPAAHPTASASITKCLCKATTPRNRSENGRQPLAGSELLWHGFVAPNQGDPYIPSSGNLRPYNFARAYEDRKHRALSGIEVDHSLAKPSRLTSDQPGQSGHPLPLANIERVHTDRLHPTGLLFD